MGWPVAARRRRRRGRDPEPRWRAARRSRGARRRVRGLRMAGGARVGRLVARRCRTGQPHRRRCDARRRPRVDAGRHAGRPPHRGDASPCDRAVVRGRATRRRRGGAVARGRQVFRARRRAAGPTGLAAHRWPPADDDRAAGRRWRAGVGDRQRVPSRASARHPLSVARPARPLRRRGPRRRPRPEPDRGRGLPGLRPHPPPRRVRPERGLPAGGARACVTEDPTRRAVRRGRRCAGDLRDGDPLGAVRDARRRDGGDHGPRRDARAGRVVAPGAGDRGVGSRPRRSPARSLHRVRALGRRMRRPGGDRPTTADADAGDPRGNDRRAAGRPPGAAPDLRSGAGRLHRRQCARGPGRRSADDVGSHRRDARRHPRRRGTRRRGPRGPPPRSHPRDARVAERRRALVRRPRRRVAVASRRVGARARRCRGRRCHCRGSERSTDRRRHRRRRGRRRDRCHGPPAGRCERGAPRHIGTRQALANGRHDRRDDRWCGSARPAARCAASAERQDDRRPRRDRVVAGRRPLARARRRTPPAAARPRARQHAGASGRRRGNAGAGDGRPVPDRHPPGGEASHRPYRFVRACTSRSAPTSTTSRRGPS